MNKYLSLSEEELQLVINNTSDKLNMSTVIIEKDLWVCILLDYLFRRFKYKNNIVFKGGTSLSKAYDLIKRFSEDIDLALHWSVLGYEEESPYDDRSNTKQQKFNENINNETAKFLKDTILPLLNKDFRELLKSKEFNFYIDENDPLTICFDYPKHHKDKAILQVIRLEMGTLAEPIPYVNKEIKTYIATVYPDIFKETIKATVVDELRTFYEKITILHREANRVNGHYPSRYSRHFYDVYKMLQTDLKTRSLKDISLLKKVVDFKKKFYTSNFARYDDIFEGKLKLVPPKEALEVFSKDYEDMKSMFFEEIIEFNTIINALKEYEVEMNNALKSLVIKKEVIKIFKKEYVPLGHNFKL